MVLLWVGVGSAAIVLLLMRTFGATKLAAARRLVVSSGSGIAATIVKDIPSLSSSSSTGEWNEYLPTHNPPWWSVWLGGTLSTIIDGVLMGQTVPQIQYRRELVVLDDGGTVAADWVVGVNGTPLEEEATAESLLQSDAPVIVAMHGLSGGQQSSYIRHFVATAARELPGWRVVVMVARGCDDLKLTTHEGFTATKYSDYGQVLAHVKGSTADGTRLYGLGFSLGAGLLGNYLGKAGGTDGVGPYIKLDGAVMISPPWNFHASTPWFGFWSSNYLVNGLAEYAKRHKAAKLENGLLSTENYVAGCNAGSIREYDHFMVVPVHGFRDVDHYYTEASAMSHAHLITTPTVALSSADDPVCSIQGFAHVRANGIGPGLTLVKSSVGGHVGFAQASDGGTPATSLMNKIIVEWCSACHGHAYQEE